jgi:chemotaxis protein methyltransferase CheR
MHSGLKNEMMTNDSLPAYGKISDEQFSFLARYLSDKYGLRIPPEKKVLIESRLLKRISSLKLASVKEYLEYIFRPENAEAEYQLFVDHITTHKTFFFRENYQFEHLKKVLPDYYRKLSANRPLHSWSAGCSTGEEVYTLGIVFNEAKAELPAMDYKIVGTDVSIPSLKKAAQGIFSSELENIPEKIRSKYFVETGPAHRTELRFSNPEITSKINLGVLNLNRKQYNLPFTFDFIFCRNVIIYFDAKTRGEVLERLVAKLRHGGYLFLGHSETALGTTLPLKSIQPTIYQKI